MRPARTVRTAVFAILIAMIGFINVSRNARFDSFHAVDVLQLIACGMCLGVALATVIAARRAA